MSIIDNISIDDHECELDVQDQQPTEATDDSN